MANINILQMIEQCQVEWKMLGEVAKLERGKTITAKRATLGNIPVISGGQKPAYFTGEFNRDGETITIAGSGAYAGFVMYWSEPIFVSDAFSIKPNEHLLLTKYVYHFLLSNQRKIFMMKKGSGVPHVYPKDVATLSIPIPPLETQKKIVKILDKFTELEAALEAALEAELSLREKQYTFYRDHLLSFADDVEWKSLGTVAKNLNSMRKPIASGLREKGDIPYYGASGIVDYVKDYIFDGDLLLISEDGANLLARNTPIAFSISGKSWVNNHAHVLQFKTYVERRFVEFYLNNIDLAPYISGAAQPKLNKQNLNNIKIPSPLFPTQQKIVDILDKFETLTYSITEGLPKEIELRRKQYEYYREKLLTFPKQ
ncbi:restriction endonuclease subunit S [Pasteurella multocida subsp. multocida]|uniref:Restriction endonuclease subunit S n=1 Tax=Pasteurella multocida TaxID=747 RepID=A0A849CK85_PASMD|nr:restriction endonuclease subunit S [Pasteurella multocida]AFI46875.1 anti-codon nuclease masking agent [Pasteurella multocida subsp. multocida str. 3480]AWW53364.1 restriction endonuclease subunit S [Pasteurella multocida]EPE71539.1 anti-codon nuclease masking agent [Pasteurella multocida 671/90]MCH1905052.1 restriction endonuclease subunit S [Pasteurella multocida]MCL7773979.1 restriction endonuclease subunit S [Pasteurella multocida]